MLVSPVVAVKQSWKKRRRCSCWPSFFVALRLMCFASTLTHFSACGVDACIACVWTDHRRALSTGGMLTCANFKAHAPKELHIASEQQLSHRYVGP